MGDLQAKKTSNHGGPETRRKSTDENDAFSVNPLCLCVSVVHTGLTHFTVLAMHGIVALHTVAIRQLPEKLRGFQAERPPIERTTQTIAL